MKRTILLAGLRRSGLHASVNALIGHFPGEVGFVNNPRFEEKTRPLEHNLHRYRVGADHIDALATPEMIRNLSVDAFVRTTQELPRGVRGTIRRLLYGVLRPILYRVPMPLPAYAPDPKTHPDITFVLSENRVPADLAKALPEWLADRGAQLGASEAEREIYLVIRTPWNCLASHLKRANPFPPYPLMPEDIREAWKDFAREALGVTRHLGAAGFSPLPFLYDRYFSSPGYRREIAALFGVEPTEIGMSKVSEFGGGSSFDGTRHGQDQGAREQRWRAFETHPLMRALLADEELRELSTKLGFAIPDDRLR